MTRLLRSWLSTWRSARHRRWILLSVIVLAAAVAVGVYARGGTDGLSISAPAPGSDGPSPVGEIPAGRSLNGEGPEPAGDPAPRVPKVDLSPLRLQLEAYLKEQEGTWGVAVMDLPSGAWFGINADTAFRTASTYKVPLVMYGLDQVTRGKARLDESVAYRPQDFETGTGILQSQVKEGDTYKLERLMELAITHSDNVAANMLLRRFGRGNVWSWEARWGLHVTHMQEGNTARFAITPQGMVHLLAALYDGRALPPEMRQKLLGWMKKTVFDERLAAGVPDNVEVAHKIGSLVRMVHDVGIIFAPERPFAVAVYSKDVADEAKAEEVIAELARLVYNYEVNLGPAT